MRFLSRSTTLYTWVTSLVVPLKAKCLITYNRLLFLRIFTAAHRFSNRLLRCLQIKKRPFTSTTGASYFLIFSNFACSRHLAAYDSFLSNQITEVFHFVYDITIIISIIIIIIIILLLSLLLLFRITFIISIVSYFLWLLFLICHYFIIYYSNDIP